MPAEEMTEGATRPPRVPLTDVWLRGECRISVDPAIGRSVMGSLGVIYANYRPKRGVP